jgi:hypothetical protein
LLSCKDASRLQSQAQDRRLSFTERFGLRLHLLICDNCRRFARQLKLIREACRQVKASDRMQGGGEGLGPDAKARILKGLASRQDTRE